MVIRIAKAYFLAVAFLAARPILARDLNVYDSTFFIHSGSEDEFFQNPAASTADEGLSAGIFLKRQDKSSLTDETTYFIIPLFWGSQVAYAATNWGFASIRALSFSSRFGSADTADGFRAGINVKWDEKSNVKVFDPGLLYRRRLDGGDEIQLGMYTFGLFGKTQGDVTDDYYAGPPIRIRREAVLQGVWISPNRFWELSGSLGSNDEGVFAPGYFRYAYPLRHLDASIRPMPWFKLGFKIARDGMREYSMEGDWKYGGWANRFKWRVSGYRDYYGEAAVATRLQFSLFANRNRNSP